MSDQAVPVPGAVIAFAYPFVREKIELPDEGGGPAEVVSWRPGTRAEWNDRLVADGIGEQVVTVISLHKPGRFPTRIFYTREWHSPDGKVFGRRRLLATTLGAFRRLTRGYRHAFLPPSPAP